MANEMKRRSFIKYTVAGMSAAALGRYMGPLLLDTSADERPYINRSTGRQVKGKPSVCAGCGAGCGIMCYVQDGQLMKISGNPNHPVNQGALCLVGQAGLYSLYDPERVKKPLLRTAERGRGRFKEISWEEAAAYAADRLKEFGKDGIALETRGGFTEKASREFLAGAGGGTLVSHGYDVSPGREAALRGTFGVPCDIPDIANTQYILNFGANPYESDPTGMRTVRALTKLRSSERRAKMVTLDPRLSATAGRSDEWLPLLPGTDAVVALAMAGVIMREGLYDKSFISRWTNVSVENLKAHLAAYSPLTAQRISGLMADDITRIAIEFAKADRAVILTGGGVSGHSSGTANERAVRLLSVITGKLDRPGCNMFKRCESIGRSGKAVETSTPDRFHLGLKSKKVTPGMFIVHGCDPVYSSPEPEALAEVLADESAVPVVMCIDTHVSDTGRYADLILPMTTYLEEYGLSLAPGPDAQPVLGYRQPVVRPMGEAMPYLDALKSLSLKAGFRLGYTDSEDYVDTLASGWKGLEKEGGLERLAKDGFCHSPKHTTGDGVYAGEGFNTPSGKVEVAWSTPKGKGLPAYAPPRDEGMGESEFVMVKFKPGGYKEGITENNLLLKEIFHDNDVLMNSSSAAVLGIKNRDIIKIKTSAGEMEVKVALTPAINPKTIAVAAGCGHEGYGNIERAERFDSSDPFTRLIWWEHGGNGVNPNKIIPFNLDPDSGGQGWMQTRVKVVKA